MVAKLSLDTDVIPDIGKFVEDECPNCGEDLEECDCE